MQPKVDYLVETIKHSSHIGKRIAFVCDTNYIEFLENKWKNIDMKLNSLQS